MATDNITANNLISQGLGQSTSVKPERRKDEVGKDEFLQLLITQLKNQDPLEPMKNEEFAVNLAQFSQLEQLISINGKLGGDNDLSSLSSYLGKEVVLGTDQIQFTKGDGGILKFDLVQDANQVTIELLNEDGSVKDVIDVGAMAAGQQSVALSSAATENGKYSFRIKAITAGGTEFQPQGRVAGIVSGLIPGPQPTLLVAGREIYPDEVVEMGLPSSYE